MRRAILLAGLLFGLGVLVPGSALATRPGALLEPSSAPATHAPPGTKLWGYEAATDNARILEYDLGTDTFTASCVPDPTANGRGVAQDPVDGNLWYTRLTGGAGPGDGLIHKVTPPPACTPVMTIPFGDGPGGTVQDDIGALDIDPDDGNLWASGYVGIGGQSGPGPIVLYKVNSASGAIMDSCTVPKGDNFNQNDTLTEAKLAGLPGSGSYLLTDAGEFAVGGPLFVVDEATCTGGGPATIVTTYPLVFAMTGADYELGALFSTDKVSIFNLDNPPFGAALATMSAAPSDTLEDITVQTTLQPNQPPDCSTAFADPDQLWPPNHKFRTVTVTGVTDPEGGTVTVTITDVTQDEPVNDLADGNTAPDAGNVNGASVDIRAERSGRGDGRVYHILFAATDEQGATCQGDVTVSVPHDRSGAPAVDSAPPSYPSL